MIDALKQPKKVYRYVALKGVNNLVPAISVIVAASFGLGWGAMILSIQVALGVLTDLTFFAAVQHTTGNGKQ